METGPFNADGASAVQIVEDTKLIQSPHRARRKELAALLMTRIYFLLRQQHAKSKLMQVISRCATRQASTDDDNVELCLIGVIWHDA